MDLSKIINVFFCNDVNNGGIENCEYCERNEQNKLICQICESGYILLMNNNSCLNIAENKELLENYEFCEKLEIDINNQLYCRRCKKGYSLLKKNEKDKGKCIKLTTSYYPCQEAINIGTSEKPIYSCTKCYTAFEYEKSHYEEENKYTKIINNRNKLEYCITQDNELKYCIEAIKKAKDGIEKYDCIKCFGDNKLIYNKETDLHYCEKNIKHKNCMVKYCKKCKTNNNYFCNECLLPNHEVNKVSGQCVEKLEEVPTIIWEDIFSLEIFGKHQKYNQNFYGPKLIIRGITKYQIKKGHSFLIYLTLRNKENNNKIVLSSICEIINIIKRNSDNLKLVDYECIANTNRTNLENYELEKIEEGDNEGLLKKSNINELIIGRNMNNLMKIYSDYKIIYFIKILHYEIIKIGNQITKDYIIDFTIEGKLNKYNVKYPIKLELELNEIDDKVFCNITKDYNKEYLHCRLDINNYKNINSFTFKRHKLGVTNSIYLSNLDKVLLINESNDENSKKKNNLKIILLCTGCVIAIGIVITIFIYISREKIFIRNQKIE